MTENEALELMKSLQIARDCEMIKTIDFQGTVIRALETLQQYRAIGTVEDIEKGIKQSEEEFNMLMEYRNIGTIEEFKALKEKSVPKKPNIQNCCANCVYAEGYTGFDDFYCNAKKCSIRAEHYDCVKFKKLDWND